MISNWMKAALFLLVIALKKLVMALVFFHWLSWLFILSSICFPNSSDLFWLINRYDGLVLNLVRDL